MKRSDLSPQQREVVKATERSILVTGGAGTGKTTVALWAARVELERPRSQGRRALFLTFSRTAVQQIASRSRSIVAPVGDRIEVSTFHAFAYRLVRRFGHVAGVTEEAPRLQSSAAVRLLGASAGTLTYDALAPLALQILNDPRVARLIRERWAMVICDEFQDTGTAQWDLLQRLGQESRLLLLGDNNQLIYGFLADKGVSTDRLDEASESCERLIELEPASRRDPTGAIPALATAVRRREFSHPAVTGAILGGRLHIVKGVGQDAAVAAIGSALDAAWDRGNRSFGVFAHTNQSVAELSHRMHEHGIDHDLIGLPDAEAEALTSMLCLVRFAMNHASWDECRVALATYLTACTRGAAAPPLARSLAGGGQLPVTLGQRLDDLREQLDPSVGLTLRDACGIASDGWPVLGVTAGGPSWTRSAPAFLAIAARPPGPAGASPLDVLATEVERLRLGAMLDSRRLRGPSVQVMNLHQTKGREADAVVLLCSDSDPLGFGGEPFESDSRVLYVVLTRARREVTVLLGDNPRELVAPLASLA